MNAFNQATPVHAPELEDCFVLQFPTAEHLLAAVADFTGIATEVYTTQRYLIFPIASSVRN
jgi:hypothetical protein